MWTAELRGHKKLSDWFTDKCVYPYYYDRIVAAPHIYVTIVVPGSTLSKHYTI